MWFVADRDLVVVLISELSIWVCWSCHVLFLPVMVTTHYVTLIKIAIDIGDDDYTDVLGLYFFLFS